MVGLYIHIPFCAKKCGYCDFASYVGRQDAMEAYVDAVICEAQAYAGQAADTVFIGGGTPSFLPPALFKRLVKGVGKHIDLSAACEFTVEANPDSMDKTMAECLKSLGATRVSMGLQAAQDALLKSIGRIHTYADFLRALEAVQAAGFAHINADLMYSLPGQTVAQVEESARAVCNLGIDHLSAYALKLEEGTPMWGAAQPDEDTDRDMFYALMETAEKAGFARYEISNFARPGGECRHNLKYWRLEDYIGLGAAAHSCFEGARTANAAGLDEYIRLVGEAGNARVSCLPISEKDREFENIMLRTRLREGIPRTMLGEGKAMADALEQLKKMGLAEEKDGRVLLTPRGMDVQNSVVIMLSEAL
ncbi:MAG: radical SAM family heme chaperone HemW [Christensenellaceae bacterium]|nr:radical SAM family heme chaperone HemW [Christensenellaceae bacterium]